MEVIQIPIGQIEPNEYNPNVVPEDIMEQLKKSIQTVGIEQPVLVRKHPETEERYIIIDGEHRWKVAKDLGITELPCTVKEVNENEAKIQTINMNKLRGEFDSLKLAEVLRTLGEVYSSEELSEKLGYNEVELQSYTDLIDFDFDALKESPEGIEALEQAESNVDLPNIFTLTVNLEQLEIIEGAIQATGQVEKSQGLSDVCKVFLEMTHPEVLLEIQVRQKKLKETIEGSNKEVKVEKVNEEELSE